MEGWRTVNRPKLMVPTNLKSAIAVDIFVVSAACRLGVFNGESACLQQVGTLVDSSLTAPRCRRRMALAVPHVRFAP